MSSGVGGRLDGLLERAGLAGTKGTVVKAAVIVGAVALLLFLVGGRGARPVEFTSTEDASTTATGSAGGVQEQQAVVVHVAGAVREPGVYSLRAGARVDDALQAAGGYLGNAAIDALNLARILVDGEQVYVQTIDQLESGEGSTASGGSDGGGSVGGLLNLNTATAGELDALPGIGPSTAQKIVDDRGANGPFGTVEDLMRVSGIGAKKLETLRDLVTVK